MLVGGGGGGRGWLRFSFPVLISIKSARTAAITMAAAIAARVRVSICVLLVGGVVGWLSAWG